MADYDLEALSLSELKKMQKDVAKAISTFEDRQKAEARAKVEALARDLGYSLAELVGTETKSSRAPAAAKYRHPENPALTWSGRGANRSGSWRRWRRVNPKGSLRSVEGGA
jgi:DNA-binding protein H-NS